jgi:hypothetical protein
MTVDLLLGFAVPFVEENFLMLALLDVTSMATLIRSPILVSSYCALTMWNQAVQTFLHDSLMAHKLAFATYIVHPIGSLSFAVHIEQP